MATTGRAKSRGCLRAAGIGCAVVLALALVAVLLAWLNRDAIRETGWYRSLSEKTTAARAELGSMLELRDELLADYPADDLQVIHSSRGADGATRSLVVEFTNPAFDLPDVGARRRTAHEIALRVAHRYPDVERFDEVRVDFATRSGTFVKVTRDDTYPFPVAELLAEAE